MTRAQWRSCRRRRERSLSRAHTHVGSLSGMHSARTTIVIVERGLPTGCGTMNDAMMRQPDQ